MEVDLYGNLQKTSNKLALESQPPFQINGVTMERVDNYKYHGVWITSNLSWNKRISKCVAKLGEKWASSIANATKMPTMPQC